MGRGRNWSPNIHLREWHEQKKLAQQVEEEERKKKEKNQDWKKTEGKTVARKSI